MDIRSTVEDIIVKAWREVLGREDITNLDNFFEIGGHSLLALQVVSRISEKLSERFSFVSDFEAVLINSIFEDPSILSLTNVILDKLLVVECEAVPPTIPKVNRNEPIPISFSQELWWLLQQVDPNSCAANIVNAFKVSGELDITSLQIAINKVVKKHESLRTYFQIIDGHPHQVINSNLSIELEVVDLQGVFTSYQENNIFELIRARAQRPFLLPSEPPLRVSVICITPEENIIIFIMHHIVSDGWSMGILYRDISNYYNAIRSSTQFNLSDTEIDYVDYTVWQRDYLQGNALQKLLDYWCKHIGNPDNQLALPYGKPSETLEPAENKSYPIVIPLALSNSIRALSRQENCTVFIVLLSALGVLLHRYTDQKDILIGTPVANRSKVEFETIIGCFINTLALHITIPEDVNFTQLLSQVKQLIVAGYIHQDLPFIKLVQELHPYRSGAKTPLIQVMLILQNTPFSKPIFQNSKTDFVFQENGTTNIDLTIDLSDKCDGKDEIFGSFEYNTDVFDSETIARMAGHYLTLLEGVVSDPDQLISELPILTENEKRLMLVEWNKTKSPYPKDKCIHQIFEEQVERTPDAIAIISEGEKLTYRELNRRANQLGNHLRKLGVGPETLVGIYMHRSAEAIMAALAILKAGGAYVPLDPTYPQDRLEFMLKDANPYALIFAKNEQADKVVFDKKKICLDIDHDLILKNDVTNLQRIVAPYNLAYVIYTSGSTGKPKGAMITHQCLVNQFSAWEAAYPLRYGTSSHLQIASFSFDAFSGDIVRALCFGVQMVMCPQAWILDPKKLYELMVKENIDYAEFTPALLRVFLQYLDQTGQSLEFLRLFIVGSDIWYIDEYKNLYKYCSPETRIINSYGLTEVTVDSTFYEEKSLTSENLVNQLVPIGHPFPNTLAYILDGYLQPVPIGVSGELYIGGDGLARGYLNRPALTAEKFIPNPFVNEPGARLYRTGDKARYRSDGTIEILGRVDNQVKIRGYRIELGEIEASLQKHPSIKANAVVVREDTPGNKYLAAYVVANTTQLPEVADLKSFLRKMLPDYMLPTTFTFLDSIPLTPSNKVDRKALPSPDKSKVETDFVAPRNEVEKIIAAIWKKLLGLENVSVYDNFFQVGGHSLLATQLVLKIRETLGIDIPLVKLFESPTVANLSSVILHSNTGLISNDIPIDVTADIQLNSAIQGDVDFLFTSDIRNIFLTGSTGFIGAYLLRFLIDRTDANVFCLVRAIDKAEGMKKVRDNLEKYDLWLEQLTPRINIVPGDLSKPFLGLTEEYFCQIAKKVDIIYHSAYWVNFIYPYEILKPANVAGTHEILRLASYGKIKPLHFLSTLSIFEGSRSGSYVKEDDPLGFDDTLKGGYNQTKWVSEQLIKIARSRNLPICVYRPGYVGGDTKKGIGNSKDFIWGLIEGCIELGYAPVVDMFVDITPVDYISKAVIHISLNRESIGKNFHLSNPEPIKWNSLIEWLNLNGYKVHPESYNSWKIRLLDAIKREKCSSLRPFISLFSDLSSEQDIFSSSSLQNFDIANTHESLQRTDITSPSVIELMPLYLSDLSRKGLIPPPSLKIDFQNRVSDENPDSLSMTNVQLSVDSSSNLLSLSNNEVSVKHSTEILHSSVVDILDALRKKNISATELLELQIQQIMRFNPTLNAIVFNDFEAARSIASMIDSLSCNIRNNILLGLPITIKDCIDVMKMPTTGGMIERTDFKPLRDALTVERFRRAGAIILGKTNVPVKAQDWQTYNPVYGRSNNPWAIEYTPGGSTGGGAAALAAGLTFLELGSDIIGSIRIPAAFCGVYGHKPSETIVPKSGHFPGHHMPNPGLLMTVQGPLARSAQDLEIALKIIAGSETSESQGWKLKLSKARHNRLKNFRVAVLPQIDWLPVDSEIVMALNEFTNMLKLEGVYTKEIKPNGLGDLRDHFKLNLSLISTLVHSDFSKQDRLDNYNRHRELGDQFDFAWSDGIIASAADYFYWLTRREEYRLIFQEFFQEWDILITPITLTTAFHHMMGTSVWPPPWEYCVLDVNGKDVHYGWQAVYPGLASLSGLPATVFPVGLSKNGLPIGLQAIGPYLEDLSTIQFVSLVEQVYRKFTPPSGF